MGKRILPRLVLFCAMVCFALFFTGCTSSDPVPPVLPPEPQSEAIQPARAEPEITEPAEEEPASEEAPQAAYILNKNTKKFHKPACRSAGQISPKNYAESFDTREDILAQG